MARFYFNDCLPATIPQPLFISLFCQTLVEFNALFKKPLEIERVIVTHEEPSKCTYGLHYTLEDTLSKIPGDDLRKFAYSLFYQCPVSKFFDDRHKDLVLNTYDVKIGGASHNATNLAIVQYNRGFLFSVAAHADLRVHLLDIQVNGDAATTLQVNNLFGEEQNTNVIEAAINAVAYEKMDAVAKLQATLGNCIMSKHFIRSFDKLRSDEKEAIIAHFQHAIKRNGVSPFYADGDLVKDVTPDVKKCTVAELRIFDRFDMRVYFHEGNRVYLGDIGFKKNDNQDAEIRSAQAILNKLVIVKG